MGWKTLYSPLTPLSGDENIDALLFTDKTVQKITYNYELPFSPHINFSFSHSEYVQGSLGPVPSEVGTMNADEQNAVRSALAYVSSITGIPFNETKTTASEDNDWYFGLSGSLGSGVTGKDAFSNTVKYDIYGQVVGLDIHDSILLTNNASYTDLTPGGQGYETLLHEIGHALGLKHPFDLSPNLPTELDNTSQTLMSYTHTGGTHSQYGPLDLQALNYLYGGDGLLGNYGLTVDAFGFPVAKGGAPAASSSDVYKPQGPALAQA